MDDNVLKVNMFGEFSLAYRDKEFTSNNSRSGKVWMLLEYLITFKDRGVSQDEIIELLWPDDSIGDPANTLKGLVHRVRKTIDELGIDSKKFLVCKRGAYSWNTEVAKIFVDTELFERYCDLAEIEPAPVKSLEYLMNAIQIYKGDFLPKDAMELWVMPISTYYHSKYVQACKKAIELLDIEGRYSDIVNICKNAVLIDPYDEGLHMSLIKALADNKQEQAAIMHYEHVIKMFYNEFGINPSEQFTAMYKDILKSTNGVEFDLSVVKERLNEKEAAKGAFYCKFEIFKEIYQLEARAQERTGRVVNICLLSVTDSEGERPEKKKLDTAMQKLHDLIKEQLRRGDVFARFSVSQYLIMLPDTTVENAEKVVLRIVKQYKRDNPRSPVELHYCLQLLGSVS